MFRNKFAAVAAAASIATLGAGAPMVALSPLALAQDPDSMELFATPTTHRAVVSGEMDWAIRDSFRDYIQGKIAKGNITYNGQPFTGSQPFRFNAQKAGMSSTSEGVIPFSGEVHFYGHDGKLDIKLSNFRLLIKGTQAQIIVDGEGTKFVDTTTKGPHTIWKDARLANIELSNPLDFTASTVRISGPTSLSHDTQAIDMFGGFYEAGEELSPVDIVLRLDDESGEAPALPLDIQGWDGTGAGGGTSNQSGRPKEGTPAALVNDVNQTLNEINNLMVTTNSLLTNADKLFNRNPSGTTSTTTGGTPALANSAANTNTGNSNAGTNKAGGGAGTGAGTGTGTLPRSNNTNPVGGTGVSPTARANEGAANAQASGGGSNSGEVCADDGARGVQQANAAWGIRQSFRNYIKGSIAKGGWELSGVSDANNAFQWTGTAGAVNVNNKSGSILFPGAIRFTGHSGILDTRFSNMEIQFSGNSGQLVLNAKSNDVEGNPHDYGRVTIADLAFTQLNISESSVQGQATTTLTAAGAEAFGQFYEPGTALDPISFTAQLGGAPNCVSGQGEANSGAGTGQGGSASQAAALRSSGGGTSAATSKVSGGGASGGTNASGPGASADGGSVFDEQDGVDSTSKSKSLGENQFQIKSAGEDGVAWDDSSVAQMLLILASFVTSGGALTRFVLKN